MHVSHQKTLTPLEAFLRAPEAGLSLSLCEYPGRWRSLACASLESESQGCSHSRGVAAELRALRLGKMNAISGSEKKKASHFGGRSPSLKTLSRMVLTQAIRMGSVP